MDVGAKECLDWRLVVRACTTCPVNSRVLTVRLDSHERGPAGE